MMTADSGEAREAAEGVRRPTDPLKLLLEVQSRDLLLDQLAYRRRELEERKSLERLEDRMRALGARAVQMRAAQAELSARQTQIEAHVGTYSSRIAAIESRMREGGGGYREVQAMSAEAESLARHRSELEDDELAVMEELEPVEAELSSIEGELDALAGEREQARSVVQAAEVAVDAEADEVRRQRQELAEGLPGSLGADYERLRQRLGGIGAARLVDGACSGCHLRLPSSERERLLHAPAGEVVHCDQCGRILVA